MLQYAFSALCVSIFVADGVLLSLGNTARAPLGLPLSSRSEDELCRALTPAGVFIAHVNGDQTDAELAGPDLTNADAGNAALPRVELPDDVHVFELDDARLVAFSTKHRLLRGGFGAKALQALGVLASATIEVERVPAGVRMHFHPVLRVGPLGLVAAGAIWAVGIELPPFIAVLPWLTIYSVSVWASLRRLNEVCELVSAEWITLSLKLQRSK